jgi:hypothetical protein
MVQESILSRLLLKALMQMPAPDFLTSLCLLPQRLHSLEPVRQLLKLHALLDQCAFKKFWNELDAWRANQANQAIVNFAEVKDFDSSIRSCQLAGNGLGGAPYSNVLATAHLVLRVIALFTSLCSQSSPPRSLPHTHQLPRRR